VRCTKTAIAEDIFVVRFDSQYGLASTFLRVQEHYESSRFRNRVFTLEEYMDWYAERFGAFTYFEDWSGFNVPSTAFDPFYQGRFDPLLKKEERLLRLFEREHRAGRPYYVIGLSSDEDLQHEIAHALYFTRPAYRKAVRAAMEEYDTSKLQQRLAEMGYHRSVLADEAHAYLIETPDPRLGSWSSLSGLRRKLRALYRQHARGIAA
jgi:hypothetical protein